VGSINHGRELILGEPIAYCANERRLACAASSAARGRSVWAFRKIRLFVTPIFGGDCDSQFYYAFLRTPQLYKTSKFYSDISARVRAMAI